MGELAFQNVAYETVACGQCDIVFAVPRKVVERWRQTHEDWYCPNGHCRFFAGKSEVEKLKEQLAEKDRFIENGKKRLDWAEQRAAQERENTKRAQRSAASYKGKLKHVKNRVGNGMCPCCRRSFQNLQRHMTTQHPKYKAED